MYINIHSSNIRNTQRWKQPKCPSTDEWINKMWQIHTTEYYSDIKRKEELIYATTWLNLKNIMLSNILWPVTKGHILCVIPFVILHVIPFHAMTRTGKSIL